VSLLVEGPRALCSLPLHARRPDLVSRHCEETELFRAAECAGTEAILQSAEHPELVKAQGAEGWHRCTMRHHMRLSTEERGWWRQLGSVGPDGQAPDKSARTEFHLFHRAERHLSPFSGEVISWNTADRHGRAPLREPALETLTDPSPASLHKSPLRRSAGQAHRPGDHADAAPTSRPSSDSKSTGRGTRRTALSWPVRPPHLARSRR
jgi:hypothetical protein